MPDDYYVSQYSGEEIDALLASAGAGTVRYDAAQTITDAQKTQARANIAAAPDGFGLGGSAALLTSADNLDNIKENGWYWWYDTRPSGAEYNYCHMKVDNGSTGALSSVTQTIYRDAMNSVTIRFYDGNTWITEYVNPPMLLGVEYRTTERYQGKPVYAKRIHCESMPSGAGHIDIQPSNTEVPNALISTAIVIRCYGRSSVAATIPFYSGSGDFMQVGVVENCKIRIYTAKAYGGTADITVHYVKSTD